MRRGGWISRRAQVLRFRSLLRALLAQPGGPCGEGTAVPELVFPGQSEVQNYEAIEVVVYRLRKQLTGTGATLMTLRGLAIC